MKNVAPHKDKTAAALRRRGLSDTGLDLPQLLPQSTQQEGSARDNNGKQQHSSLSRGSLAVTRGKNNHSEPIADPQC